MRCTLGSVVTAVGQSGLRITHLLEMPDYDPEPDSILGSTGWPIWYILRAVKDSDRDGREFC